MKIRYGNLMERLLICIIILITSCIDRGPIDKIRRPFKIAATEDTRKKNDNETFGPPLVEENVYWSNKQTSFVGTLDVSKSFDSVVYLRGKSIDTYLKEQITLQNKNDIYCLVFNFNNPHSKDQYRVRAVPISASLFKEKIHEYVLRVDLNIKSEECNGDVNTFYGTTLGKIKSDTDNSLIYATTLGESSRGFYTYSSNTGYSNTSSLHGLASNSVRDIWADNANPRRILVATSQGLSMSTNGNLSFFSKTTTDGLISNSLSSIYADFSVQNLVIGSDGSGISLSSDGGQTFTNKTTSNGLSSNGINGVWTNGTVIFVATDRGLDYSINFGSSFTSLLSEKIEDISSYESGSNSRIFISSRTGLYIYETNGNLVKKITMAQGLPSNKVYTSFYDGNTIAVATNTGVALYNDPVNSLSNTSGGPIEVITTSNGLANNNVKGVLIQRGIIYLNTSSKFYRRNFSQTDTAFEEIPPATFTLSLKDVCSQCVDVTSFKTKLYRVDPDTYNIRESSLVRDLDQDIAGIGLKILEGADEQLAGASCSQTHCSALGYDCCLDGQCVQDGEEKPEALGMSQSDPSGFGVYYNEARHQVSENPSSFMDYTDIYYVCSQSVPQKTVEVESLKNPELEAERRFEREKKEYFCLQSVKENSKDYSQCWDDNGDAVVNNDDWDSVRKKVWKRCGCRHSSLETPYCPDFGLKAQKNAQNDIIAIVCDVPRLIQKTEFFLLSSRSVPHRFYRSDNGNPVDDIYALFREEGEFFPEGDAFSYLDSFGKTEPNNGRFNINSIFGQMKVDLTKASPAKVIPVEYDQDYIIMATRGQYSPCLECARDSWFNSFSAYPSSSMGMGLQATGRTTRRDIFARNTTLGNYEDTLFGRACWVPPTMIPFTHMPLSNTVTQRRRRLSAQAALYINGYQRDWYGFNKGALIGSFDGVQWFAIGVGRRVTAASDKLYLAVNSPFGDLASTQPISVNITVDVGGNEVSDFDFNPELSLEDSKQNQGATCQYYHLCDTDIDCVTQLGWEYMCANISYHKASWPRFTMYAEEKENAQVSKASFSDIIFGDDVVFNRKTKRCVYRGAGSICSRDLTVYPTDNEKKLFACAPNFYCEGLFAGSYNEELSREPDGIRKFFYGQEGNVLGRPLDYVGARDFLTDEIIENLQYNASSEVYQSGKDFEATLGICRPGKNVSPRAVSWIDQQRRNDYLKRSDYINQISSCDSQSYEHQRYSRVQSCPTFILDEGRDDFGNYVHFQEPNPFNAAKPFHIQSYREQNMCGNEASTENDNPFASIEADSLNILSSILAPTLVKDACFKRAGSPCFTNLDCSPNRLHIQESLYFDHTFFGGSLAEYEYWSQELVCSQDEFSNEFTFNKNRCCREMGKDFTMYTRIENATDDLMDYLGLENGSVEQNPQVELFPGQTGNNRFGYSGAGSGEYSRYRIVDMLMSTQSNYVGNGTPPRSPIIHLDNGLNTAGYQWKTFNEVGAKTCCGGNWIRKFADGTHNWTDFKKLRINFENFQCLNYTSPLGHEKPTQVTKINWQKEADKLCLSPAGHGCIQWGIYEHQQLDMNIQAPKNFTPATFAEWKEIMEGTDKVYGPLFSGATGPYESCFGGGICGHVDTTPEEGACGENALSEQRLNPLAPYQPLLLKTQQTADNQPHRASCVQVSLGNSNEPVQLTLSLPVYIGHYNNIQGIQFKFFDQNGDNINQGSEECENPLDDCGHFIARGTPHDRTGNADCSTGDNLDSYPFATYFDSLPLSANDGNYDAADVDGLGAWCVHDDNQGRQVLKVAFNKYAQLGGTRWVHASIRIEFNPIGTSSWTGPPEERQSLLPGNDLYYLTKLGRLELLGIPQLFYGPLYCTHNYDKLVPDLYSNTFYSATDEDDRSRVESSNEVFEYSTSRYGIARTLEKLYDEDFSGTDYTKAVGGSTDGYFMYSHMINHEAVFSAHEFTCCQGIGEKVNSIDKCCSGFGIKEQNDENMYTCKLPKGTNLNVYFNRFVSNEGEGEEKPGGGLAINDFIPETGEIKLKTSSYEKLRQLGAAYCESGSTTRGGLFGFYQGSPNLGFVLGENEAHSTKNLRYSLADEVKDYDDENSNGNNGNEGNKSGGLFFQTGLHWDHHIYCGLDGSSSESAQSNQQE